MDVRFHFLLMIATITQFWNLVGYWKQHPIASKDLNGTLLRFIRWQLGSRLLGAPVVWPWIGSTRLLVDRGMTGVTMNVYCGLHEFPDMAFLLHFLRSEDCFIDVGANVGSYSILASGVVGARSMCVEPISHTFEKLLLNLSINGLEAQVRPVRCGLGDHDGMLPFVADQDTMNRVAPLDYQGRTQEVPVRAMDSLFNNFSAALWKIDVEGFEEQVLSGAVGMLKCETLRAVQIEGDSQQVRKMLSSHGFKLYNYDPFGRSLVPEENKRAGHNWLWVRDPEGVSERCRLAPKITIGRVVF